MLGGAACLPLIRRHLDVERRSGAATVGGGERAAPCLQRCPMRCPSCGKEVAQTDATCGFCGSALSPEPHSSAESLPSADVAAPPGGLELSPRKSGKAIASLIFGLFPFVPWVGLLSFVFGSYSPHLTLGLYPLDFVAALVAIILGQRAKAAIRLSGGQLRGKGIAIAGLALAYLWLAGSVLVMGISAFIANS